MADSGPVRRGDELDKVFRQARLRQRATQGVCDGGGGIEAFRSAAQDHRIPGPHAQARRVGGHVRPALIDDPDHAERDRDTGNVEPVRTGPARQFAAHRVGQAGNGAKAGGDAGYPSLAQRQAVHQGRAQRLCAAQLDVFLVRLQDGRAGGLDRARHGFQRCRAGLGRLGRRHGRSPAGAYAHVQHDGFQRRGLNVCLGRHGSSGAPKVRVPQSLPPERRL